MGYFCFLCNCTTNATTVNSFVHHFHFRHGITAMQKCKVSCGQQDCLRTFDGIHAFRMHLKRYHATDPHPMHDSSIVNGAIDVNCGTVEMEVIDTEINVEDGGVLEKEGDTKLQSTEDIQNMFTDFMIVLKSKNVAQSVITFVSHGFVNLLTCVTQYCAEPLSTDNTSLCASRLEDVHNMCESGLTMSDYKIKKHLCTSKGLVEPSEISFGNRTESVASMTGSEISSTIKFVPESMQYVSVIKTIQKLMCDTDNFGLLRHIQVPTISVDPVVVQELLCSYSDGDYYKSHPLRSINPEFLQLQFFYDEFETANPLGSKANIHKLGGLGCICL